MGASKIGPRAQLLSLLEPVVRSHGRDLEDVVVSRAGSRTLVRVVVDGDGGVDLDAVAEVSRAIADVLDDTVAISGAYVLEVTSPGVDRPLTAVRHWRRALGRVVQATCTDGAIVTGRVQAADDDGVTLSPDNGETLRLEYNAVTRATVQVEFSRLPDQRGDQEHPSTAHLTDPDHVEEQP